MNLLGNQKSLYGQNFLWFAISFFLFFIASKSLGLTLGYALDDYATLGSVKGHMQAFLISQGRFTFALLQSVMDLSDLKQPELAGLGFFLSAGGLMFVCWVTLSRWLQKDLMLALAVGALLGAHSFFAEYVSFRQSLFPMGVCFVLIAGATKLLAQDVPVKISRLLLAAGLAAMASGINQLAMAFFCIAVLGISLQKSIHLPAFHAMLLAVKSSALIGSVASIFYLVIYGVATRIVAVGNNSRMSILGFDDIPERSGDVAVLLTNIFSGNHPLVGPIAAICTAIAILALSIRASTRLDEWMRVLTSGIVLVLAIAIALLPTSISGEWWPMPRTLIALPLAVALGIAILSIGASRFQLYAAIAALFIASVIFSGKSGALLLDQQRLNRWDIGLARDVIQKISETRQVDASTPILIHRAKWAHEIDQSMPIGDANTSALSVGWAVDALFEEATGRRLNVKLGVQGDMVCDKSPSFPNSGSIHQVDGVVHVCF